MAEADGDRTRTNSTTLANKRFLIVGGSSGFGLITARAAAAAAVNAKLARKPLW